MQSAMGAKPLKKWRARSAHPGHFSPASINGQLLRGEK